MKKLITSLFVLFCSVVTYAQDSSAVTPKKFDHQIKILPLPVIASNPTSGWMFGLAPGGSWYMGDPANTSISSMLGSLIYTTKKQWIITLKANTFFAGDKYNLLSDMRFFITSQPTYGLGTGPQSAKPLAGKLEYSDLSYGDGIPVSQMMEFNYFRFHQTLLKRHHDTRFFYGLGYHLDMHTSIQDNVQGTIDDDGDTLQSSHYIYQTEVVGMSATQYTLSGVSLNLLYDSRDNAVNPYKGRYAFANIRMNPTFLGSTKSSSILWLEYRDYLHLSKNRPRHMIGFWTYGWFVTGGDVPYLDLPAIGWDQFGRSGRAYTQGRFRGEDLTYGEIEYRFPLQREKETLGGVVFVNGVSASNRNANIDLMQYINVAYGMGLRVMINKKSRANLTIDYAWGDYGAQGFYLGMNEVF